MNVALTLDDLAENIYLMRMDEPKRLASYIVRILKEAVKKSAPFDECRVLEVPEGYMINNGSNIEYAFLSKVMKLIQMLVDQGLYVDAFHKLVLLKSLYKGSNKRIAKAEGTKQGAHVQIDAVIRMFVDEGEIPTSAREEGDSRYGEHSGVVLTAGLYWDLPLGDSRLQSFWNFASAARTLSSSSFASECGKGRAYDEGYSERESEQHSRKICFHYR